MRARDIKKLIKFGDLDGQQKRDRDKLHADQDTQFISLRLTPRGELKQIRDRQLDTFQTKKSGFLFWG